jgi:diaminopimelate decarboxylase
LLIIHDAGAYGYTMSSNYNTRGKAVQVAVQDGEDRCISAAETFDDMIRLEIEYMKGDICEF